MVGRVVHGCRCRTRIRPRRARRRPAVEQDVGDGACVQHVRVGVRFVGRSFRTLVHVVPLSFQSHVPDPGDRSRRQHGPPVRRRCVQTLDCGFSPVFAEIGRGSSVAQSSEPNPPQQPGQPREPPARSPWSRQSASPAGSRTAGAARRCAWTSTTPSMVSPRRQSGALDRAGRRSCFDRVSEM